ncbi:hypothetical protein C5167_000951 [Papaver somniferum]|uniref:Uncharacterized protein n=1 Tax=Papaver somniferum TaxID=3469 RepID=A0A4Y7KTZ9_PAPSO|nr:hypothetical protein C5167_000951 [Papaver somniferum]
MVKLGMMKLAIKIMVVLVIIVVMKLVVEICCDCGGLEMFAVVILTVTITSFTNVTAKNINARGGGAGGVFVVSTSSS